MKSKRSRSSSSPFRRKYKRHKRKWQHVYVITFLILAFIVVGLWAAQFLMKKEVQHTEKKQEILGTSEDVYNRALEEHKNGDKQKAHILMKSLARLSDRDSKPIGYGKAHLWMAQQRLSGFDTDFIWEFPLEKTEDEPVSSKQLEDFSKAQRHLKHAVKLNPELKDALMLLVAIYMRLDKYNEAMDVLIDAVTHPKYPHPDLHIPLANNLLSLSGDFTLRNKASYTFSLLGEEVSSGRERSISKQVSYVLSALMLKRFENADITIRRIESQRAIRQSTENKSTNKSNQIPYLRVAYHYHRAIDQLEDSDNATPSQDISGIVQELQKAVEASPEMEPLIRALSHLGEADTNEREKILKLLEKMLSDGEKVSSKAKSKIYYRLSEQKNLEKEKKKVFLEQAVKEDPENGQALTSLLDLLIKNKNSDKKQVIELAHSALKHSPEEQKGQNYRNLGAAYLEEKKWFDAIINLEKALNILGSKASLHEMLSEAYAGEGKNEIAQRHREAIQENTNN